MNLESSTQIHESLLRIKDTVTYWNAGGLQDNEVREVCKDIHRTCYAVIDVIDGFLAMSDEEEGRHETESESEVRQHSCLSMACVLSLRRTKASHQNHLLIR
jgi:hypothetical protein